jgi:hypothetical protein
MQQPRPFSPFSKNIYKTHEPPVPLGGEGGKNKLKEIKK